MISSQRLDGVSDSRTDAEIFCAWCGRFQNPDGTWATPTTIRLLGPATHGMCPDCVAAQLSGERANN